MIEGFGVVFLSILIEALPFVMLGAVVASLIEVFVTPSWLVAHLPKNPWIAFPLAGLMGLVFPVCECAIVPITRRLIAKGVPVGLAITMMMAIPIVNPVVLMSTFYAFPNSPVPWLRGGLGYIAAVLIGLALSRFSKKDILKADQDPRPSSVIKKSVGQVVKAPNINQNSIMIKPPAAKPDVMAVILKVLGHTQHELYDVGRFLILGAFVSAVLQVFVPRAWLLVAGNNPVASVLLMMTLAFVLSLCSEADAFVASTFRYQFTTSSLVGFLIFGPMIDIKNTLMLAGVFKANFVRRLILTITLVCFTLALLLNMWF